MLAPGLLVILFAGCELRSGRKPPVDETERMPRVETIRAQYIRQDVTADLAATVEALEKTDLCAQVRGVVKPIPPDVDLGRVVKKDEVLLELDIPDLVAEKQYKEALREQAVVLKKQAEKNRDVAEREVAEAAAQVERHQADLLYRQLQHKRVEELAKRETVQPQLTEEARLFRDAAAAALKAGKAQVETKNARLAAAGAEVEAAESRALAAQREVERLTALVAFATVKAPFAGVITKRWVDSGTTVKDPGMPLLTVARMDSVRVILDVPERMVPHVNAVGKPHPQLPANPVTLRVPALQDATFEGRVTLLAGVLDPATRTMRTEVHLENRDGRLRPQMTGTARLTLVRREKVLTIPSSALVRAGDKLEVYYVDNLKGSPPSGVVKRVEVELGLDDGRNVEVRSGLTGQEHIVAKGNGVVRAGEMVIAAEARSVGQP
jgi:RND family efflux transporter MFP subunit